MTVWLDGHFGPDLALRISSSCGVACRTLKETGLQGVDDHIIFEAAGRFPSIVLLTKDADFAELAHRRGPPPQVIWLRCPNLRSIRLLNVIQPHLDRALEEIRSGTPLVEVTIKVVE